MTCTGSVKATAGGSVE